MNRTGYYLVIALCISIFIGYCYGQYLHKTPDALNVLVALLSILAGVLVAVISIVGDPSMLLAGSWRLAFEHAKDTQKRLSRFSHLFALYVLTLIFVVLATLIEKHAVEPLYWVFNILTGLSTLSLLLSLPLPYALMNIQIERMDHEIKKRRNGN